MIQGLLADLGWSLRSWRRRWAYALAAVAILAVGLSGSLAAFTYINGFQQPFPGVGHEGLVRLYGASAEEPYQDVPYLDYLDYAAAATADGFEGLAATQPFYAASVRLEAMTEVAFLEAVSGNYFETLAIETALGRGLEERDDRSGASPVAVLSHAWWQRSFEGDASVIGSTIFLNFRPFTVVGVAAPDFLGTASSFRPDVWIPFAPFRDRYVGWARRAENRDIPLVRVYGRLREGVSLEQAQARLGALARGQDASHPRQKAGEVRRPHIGPATWIDPTSRLAEQPTLRLMMVATGVLLLLACANVANLLLSVAMGRQRELSIRAALGASPGRLFRLVLVENLLLSGVAGLLALSLAVPLASRLGSYFARPSVWGADVSREITLDGGVALFALLASLGTGLLAGLLPALRAARRDLVESLKGVSGAARAGRMGHGWRRLPGLHDTLVAAQACLSVVLLVVAGLVLQTLLSVGSLDPGFSYDRLVVTHISTSSTTLEVEDRERFFRELRERLQEEPWVETATVADYPLLSQHPTADMRLEGVPDPVPLVYSRVVPGFFDALGIELLGGRGFVPGDRAGSRDVAIVNEALARRFFSAGRVVGRRVWWAEREGEAPREYEIVGLVRDTRTQDFFAEPDPTLFVSYPQHAYPSGSALLVNVKTAPRSSLAALHRWLREYEPHLAIVNVISYEEIIGGFLYAHRMNAEMFSVLALVGLLLAAVGVFSVVTLGVGRKTREIGIRISIGADRWAVRRLIVGRALAPVLLGLAGGLVVCWGLRRVVEGLLHGVAPGDPLTLLVGAGVLAGAAVCAAAVPAQRAALVNPVRALRQD